MVHRAQQHGHWKKPQSNVIFLYVFQLSCGIKKIFEGRCINNIHTGKKFFTAPAVKGLWVVSFQIKHTLVDIFWPLWVFFTFLEKRTPNKYCLREVNLTLYYYHVTYDSQSESTLYSLFYRLRSKWLQVRIQLLSLRGNLKDICRYLVWCIKLQTY